MSEELPEWMRTILESKMREQTNTEVHSFASGFYTAIAWVLSLKPEDEG